MDLPQLLLQEVACLPLWLGVGGIRVTDKKKGRRKRRETTGRKEVGGLTCQRCT